MPRGGPVLRDARPSRGNEIQPGGPLWPPPTTFLLAGSEDKSTPHAWSRQDREPGQGGW